MMVNMMFESISFILEPNKKVERKADSSYFLPNWAIEHKISQTAIDSLLEGLSGKTCFMLPKTSKTLLKTARSVDTIAMSGGTYCHIGIEKCLIAACSALSRNNHSIPEKFILDFNIDGVSYSKSTKSSLTLIQMNLKDVGFDPFVVGAYVGEEKPECNELLMILSK